MKVIRTKNFPFWGYRAILLFGILFVRGLRPLSDRLMNHEEIHSAQFKEVTIALFPMGLILTLFCNFWIGIIITIFAYYVAYCLEWFRILLIYTKRWVVRWVKSRFKKSSFLIEVPYKANSFEREAYDNEKNLGYLEQRKRFDWIEYIK